MSPLSGSPPDAGPFPGDLKRREERLRSRLADTLQSLDFRRREVLDLFNLRHQLHEHRGPLLCAGAGLLLVVGASVGYAAYRAHDYRQHKYRERWLALQRMWEHPERILR
jgi:hypothetical protein